MKASSVIAFVAVVYALSADVSRAQSPEITPERHAYADAISRTYNFRFGQGVISAPGNAAVEGNTFLPASSFPKAEYCARCHKEAYCEWRQALHSNSFRTPFYRTSVNILARTKGIEYTRHCDSCHNPIAVLSGALTQDSQVDRGFDEDGLTCMTCHSIVSVDSTNGNGGYVMGVPAVMVDEHDNRIPGEVPDSEIMAHPDRHSKAVMRDLYRQPEFCAACHKANMPKALNDYKFIRAFTVFDEWQNSKFSNRNPLNFYSAPRTTCQKCHMVSEPANPAEEYGVKNGVIASHRWIAGNTAVPFYYGFDEQLKRTVEFLKSTKNLNVDVFGIRKAHLSTVIAPLGSTPFRLEPKDMVELMVVVQNKTIGHSLIPEVRDLYEAWVECVVKDAGGKEIYHSGFLKPDGALEESAHSFTNRPVNIYGNFVDNHMVWGIHSMAYDNSIQSGRSALVRYMFEVPADARSPLTVTARVNYRHFRQSYLNNIFGKDHPDYPVVEMASRSRTLRIGENPVTPPDANDNPDWMRWNNLGVALLDQLQYAEAIDAFEQVVKLRPDYADGYINIGLTDIEWEKYSEARPSLEKALSLNQNNGRALYYLALVERRERHTEQEIADLEQVVSMYPQARDPRRELGISYYQQHRYSDARQQFEALQAIDPDDLAAHYNLAILYRRAGMKDKAAEQAAMFATRQIDPGAPTYSLEFLRQHPEISIESVPWHIHRDPSAGSMTAQASH